MSLEVHFGFETEYGITRDDPKNLDVVAESIALVRRATEPGVRAPWDYSLEDPHVDARGFRVKELRQDTDEAAYFEQDSGRKLSFTEIKSDYVLENGARYYNDHAHPEYCTPECSTLLELIQQDMLGDRLVENCRRAVNRDAGDNPVQVFKNNTDFQGHSYGCHENYLIPRSLPWEELAQSMAGFLATRQIYAGAGKFGWEEEDRFAGPGFQISQRGDFFSVFQSVDTMQRRPLVNTRDEPHANPQTYRRFHVIIGDANLSPYANYLKVGATAIVLHAISRDSKASFKLPRLQNPVTAVKSLSRDDSWRWELALADGSKSSAVDVQRRYLDFAAASCPDSASEWRDLLQAWSRVLDDLSRDPLSTADRLDWSAKFRLIDAFRESEGLKMDDPWLRSLDLAYHSVDPEASLFQGLLAQDAFQLPYPMDTLRLERFEPPASTRAALRGGCIEKFKRQITSAQWDHIRLRNGSIELELDFRNLFGVDAVSKARNTLRQADQVSDLRALPFAREIIP